MTNGFSFLGLYISWYSILGLMGMIVAGTICFLRRKRYDVPGDDILNLAGYALIGAIVGSKVLALICVSPYIVKYWDNIHWNLEFFKLLMSAGFVFYGGLIGVIVMFYIYCRQFKMSFANIMELFAPAVPAFHVFGRMGCLVAGCCYGANGFPWQIVASFVNLCILTIIIFVQNKGILKGKSFYLYMIIYGVCRFILEFLRGDMERGFISLFSVSQWISIAFMVVAVLLWKKSNKKVE